MMSSLLVIYPKDAPLYNRDTYSTVLIAALFKALINWKQPRHSSTGKSVKKKWYIYTIGYYSAIKKNKTMKFASK